ncbi:MAG: InlB B-repeat-containing protein [Absicoccus sp.]|uniref:DUF7507 domain-containing protein n=1 Tax=Absicoccus sp. TaxID=2718527 RepID=UPI002A74B6F6|nr:InlB B-repeat-containing protein [Absicoccus sp.]MDY3035005.1 InlB B-repeat-containing protein [Absicoccus sp.]
MQKGIKKLLSVLIVFGMVVSTFTSSVTPTYGEDITEQPTTETTAETPSTEEANQTTESNVPQKTDTSPSEQTTTEPQATTEVETTPQEEPTTQTATNEEDTNTTSNEEEKVSYPAQNFSKSAGKITVHVSAVEGIFPEGTTMTITPVSSTKATQIAKQTITGNEKVEDAIGVDITFYDSSGKEIEPKDGQGVQVNMQLNESLKGKDFTVVHQEDNGTVQTVSQNASAQGATFQANAFSIYVITGIGTEDEDPAVATYQFHDANGDVYSTQKVKNGEILTAPETPEKEGNIFKGWATSQGASEANFDITKPVTVEKTSTVDVYPVFSQKLYVFFTDKTGRVFNTKEGAPGDVITTSDVSVPLGSEESVTGWYTDKALTNAVSEVTLSDHNVTLYPKIEKGHYLYFSTGDNASYIEPEFVAAGKQTQKPNDPTRPGYTFKGWSTTEGGSVNYHFGQTLSDNQTIYAVWSANTDTSYTVIYWKQSVNDSKDATDSSKTYDYDDSETRKGKTGDVASPSSSDQNKNYTGFRYNASKSTSVSINGDGTTVLNVYYDRISMTINFRQRNTLLYTFTGLYGQTLKQNGYSWPSPGYGYRWVQDDNTTLTFLDAFIFDDLDYTPDKNGNQTLNLTKYTFTASNTIRHYKQNIDGSYNDATADNSTQVSNGSFTFTNKYTGFTVSQYRLAGGSWTNTSAGKSVPMNNRDLEVRYTRNSYELAFYNYNGVSREESVLYEQSLNSFANYTPARPSGIPDSFTFQGWYKDPETTQKFDFHSVMPAAGLTLYAKWAAPTYTATIHTTMSGDGMTIPIDVQYGEKINPGLLPTVKDADGNILSEGSGTIITIPENTEWVGWATKDGNNYTTFNLDTQLYSDIVLYPHYLSTQKYMITYDANGGGGSVTDPKQYVNGTYADIQSAKGLTAPNKKSFLYWATDKNGSGTTYYPGDKIEVTGNMTLYAIYGDPAKTTSLTYHSNYPDGVELTKKQTINNSDELENNVSFKAYTNTEAGFAVPNGYYFDGWKDSSGKSIQAGETILVDNTSDNDLYAQWKKKKSLVIQVTGNEASHVYDGKSHSASGYTLSYTVDGKATSDLPSGLTLDESAAQAKAATGKKAGTYAMGLTAGDFEVTGNDLNKYSISIQVSDGHLLVTKRQVTLTSESATKKYDGKALTKPDVTVSGAGFVDDEVSNIKATGSITKVGSTTNTITYTENSGFDKENYTIQINEGTLTITTNEDEITIRANHATKVYDGTPLSDKGFSVTGLPDGYTAEVTTSGSITDVGETNNVIQTVVIKDSNGNDVTDQFSNIIRKNGVLSVTKRQVTLTSESASKVYDGKALTKPDVTVGGDGFVDGEVTDIKATGSITEVGGVTNTITYTTQGGFKETNYDITKTEGTLVITHNANEIIVRAKDATKLYDGKALRADAEVLGLPDGYTADVETSGSITDVGVTVNRVTLVSIKNADGKDVTNQFSNIVRVNGTLTVNKRSVVLSSRSATKTYDGTALTSPTVTISGDGFVDGEVSNIRATGSITKVGSTPNTIAYDTSSKFDEDNYDIVKNEGTLTITHNKDEIVVTAHNASKTYDGSALTNNTYDIVGLPDGYTAEVHVQGSITDVGKADNVIQSVLIKKGDEDVTDQFENITRINGTLTVTKRTVHLTSQSLSKEYDGTPLSAPTVSVSGDGFVDGEVSDIKAIGTITEVGGVPNTISYTENAAFNANNYEITKTEGTLSITQNSTRILVKANDAKKKYDGTALKESSATVTGLPDGFVAEVTTEGSITNAGATDNLVASVVIKKDNKDVTNQFSNIIQVAGLLTVSKRTVTLTSESASKVYDGKALTKPNVTVSGDGFVDGEVSNIHATGSITNVGGVTNFITYTENDAFRSGNYEIIKSEGILTVTQNQDEITVRARDASKKYDGAALTEKNADVFGLPDGYTAEVVTSGSITDVGNANNVVANVIIRNADGNDVTNQFANIIKINGTLTVYKRTVILSSESATKPYNGKSLRAPDVTVTGDGFVDGQVSNIHATGKITEVGSVPNPIEYTTHSGFKDSNYEIIKNEGALVITQNTDEILVKANDATKTYDGTALEEKNAEVTGLPDGFSVEVTTEGSITNVGTTDNTVQSVVIKYGDKDVTDQFANIIKVNGTLTVNKRYVNLASNSASKAYDGKALTDAEVTISGDGFVDGEVSDIKAIGTITKVGSVTNTISYTTQPKFKADNYDIFKNEGTLTITRNSDEIVVAAHNGTKLYDGIPLTQSDYDITGLGSNYTAEVKITGSITDVGEVANVVESVIIRDIAGNDVTDQFEYIQRINGVLKVNKRTVNLMSESASKEYDGTPLTVPNVAVKGDGFVTGEVSDIQAVGTITNVGSVKNDITYTKNSSFKADNYDITEYDGTLTITSSTKAIYVKANDAQKTYDGTALEEKNATVTGLPAGFTAEVTTSGSITDAGVANNDVTSVKILKDGNDVTNQFVNIITEDGTLTVNKRVVNLKSDSKAKKYDGMPLTAPTVTVSGDGFVSAEAPTVEATGTITDVGSTINTIKLTYTPGSGFKQDNYEINLDEGTLAITSNEDEIVIAAHNATKVYDGTPLTQSGYDYVGLPTGFTMEVTTSGSITNVGTAENVIAKVVIRNSDGKDVTNQFAHITKVSGTLTVTKRSVNLSSSSASKEYDGTPLTASTVTVSGDGFVDGEVSNLEAIGSITKVGSTPNAIEYTAHAGFNAGNYEIVKNEGTLKITPNTQSITVKAGNATREYNGVALVYDRYSVTGLPEGFTIETSVSGQQTNVGSTDNVVGDVVIKKGDEDVTNQFAQIKKVNGKLTVTKRVVNLSSSSASKEYDGQALTAPTVAITGDGFLDTEVSNVRATGTITKVGTEKNTIAYDTNTRFNETNYEINKTEGTLEIVPNTDVITVKAKSMEKMYDGTTLSDVGADVSGLPEGFSADVQTSGSIKNVGTKENKITSVKIMKDNEDVTSQFANIVQIDGTLTINPRTVHLRSESADKIYDGTPLVASKVTITGDGFVEGEVSDIEATGFIKKVGSVKNAITYKTNATFNEVNYVITKDEGTLTITQSELEIVVNARSVTKRYDGTPLTESNADVLGLPKGYTAEVKTKGTITNVGTVDNIVESVVIKDADQDDVTDQFKSIQKNPGTLTIIKRKVNVVSASGTKEYDGTPLTAPSVRVSGDGFVDGEISDLKATGTITKVGTVKNTIAYTENKETFKASNYAITYTEGQLTITPNTKMIHVQAKDAEKTYDGTSLNEDGYVVTGLPDGFSATATTTGEITDAGKASNLVSSVKILKGDEDVTDQFANIHKVDGTLTVNKRKVNLQSASASKVYDGKALTSPAVTVSGDTFVDGEVTELKANGSQLYVGESKNEISYKKGKNFKDDNYIVTLEEGTLTVTDENVPTDLVVTKKHDSKTYQAGDTIHFTIEVTNIYDKPQTITIVEQDDVQITGENVFTNVAPGETVTTTATHVVSDEDVNAKEYTNIVTAKFEDGKDYEGQDKEDQFGRLEISKTVTSTPKEGNLYKNGETISYRITVKNTGNTVAKNVQVHDDLTGLKETLNELAAGEEKSFDTTYVVTDQDAKAGKVSNVATVSADNLDPVEDKVDTPVETSNPSLLVEKTSDKDSPAKLGETIHYTVKVTNTGNVTIKNVTVDDELTDDHWDVGTLKPGESQSFDTQYKVTEADVAKGKVVNVATADGEDSTGDKPDVTPGEVTNETEKSQPHLTLTKTTTSTPQNKDGYTKGETITYRIKAENDGNVELRDIKVEDPLTKDTWSIESLQPGESKTWTTSYIVTEADQVKGSVVNDVTASAKTSTGDDPVIVPGHTSDKILTPKKVNKENTNTGVESFGGTYAAAMLAAAGLLLSLKRRRKDDE